MSSQVSCGWVAPYSEAATLLMMMGRACRVSSAANTQMFIAGKEPVTLTATRSPRVTPASWSISTKAAAKLGLADVCLETRCPSLDTMIVCGGPMSPLPAGSNSVSRGMLSAMRCR